MYTPSSPALSATTDGAYEQTAREAALSYASLGWSVIPTKGKRPHPAALTGTRLSWRPFRDAPADEQQIAEWYERAPDAGVAVLTGSASRIVVCDIEKDGLDQVPDEIRFAATPAATTPRGGLHVYFASEQPVQTSHRFAWGDLQADGAYVVAPGGASNRKWLRAPTTVPLADWCEYANLLIREEGQAHSERLDHRGYLPLEGIPSQVENLADWDRHPLFVRAFCALVGITAPIGEKFRCVLPEHGPDTIPSANLWVDPETQRVLYRCWQTHATFALAQVYAAITSGRPAEAFTGPTLAVWKLRLLIEGGLVATPVVSIPALPADAPDEARDAYPGLVRLFQARALSKMGLATAITARFLADWCGISGHAAREARHYFRTHGIIHKTGRRTARADLYLPGTAPNARRST